MFPQRCTALVALISLVLTATAGAKSTEEVLRAGLGDLPPHPRLFLHTTEVPALQEKLAADPLLGAARDHLIAAARNVMEQPPVERQKTGKRLLGVSRKALQRIGYLALAYRLTDEQPFAERAEQEMLAAAAFTDWNPSHFLDVAEMTAALAIGYDWLYGVLSEESRETIRTALIELGLRTSLDGGWWVDAENNWNQVCHGGLALGALAVAEHAPDLAQQVITRGRDNIHHALAAYEPDGIYPEGPAYWQYGTTYNVLWIAALESAQDDDLGLGDHEAFRASADFYLHATGATGRYFNFADGGSGRALAPAMHWFARRLARPALLWNEREALEDFARREVNREGDGDRMLPFLLIWAQPTDNVPAPAALHWMGHGENPVAMHRSAWDPAATYLGFKGGTPAVNHGHMDIGSFVLERDGVRWAVDLGAQNYNSLEQAGIDLWNRSQDSERWTVFRLNNYSHNTLVVNDALQRVGDHAPIVDFAGEPDRAFSIVDMQPVYRDDLAAARRGVRLFGRDVLVQDELVAREDTSVRWGMATRAQATVEGQAATLRQEDAALTLRVLEPAGVKLEVISLEQPAGDHNTTNPNTRMIAFFLDVPADTETTVRVWLGDAGANAPSAQPLAAW